MKKHLCRIAIVLILAATLGPIIMSTGCSQPNHEGFAIYSTKENISPDKISDLNQITIAGKPIIGLDDIVSYNQTNHAIILTKNAFMRIIDPDLPAWGNTFVVCVDRKPIYWGAVLTMASSVIYDGVTIIAPFPVSQEVSPITIGLGYPSPEYFKGKDPRNNVVILESLRLAGKLITSEGFAIYLTKDNISPAATTALDQVKIADKPIIDENDIISYSAATYEMTLTQEAVNRLTALQVPMSGTVFIASVDKKPVYQGAFWSMASSEVFGGVIIMLSVSSQNTISIRFNLEGPFSSHYIGLDPRNDTSILVTLRQAGKLIDEGFAIYLTKDNVSPAAMPALDQVVIADQPVIGLQDIIAYDSTYHQMTLTAGVVNRLAALQIPMSGKPFVVCVDKKPVYWGAFWSLASSAWFSGVTIMVPFAAQVNNPITFVLGDSSLSFYNGVDPRNNVIILESLRLADKLKPVEGFAIYLTKDNIAPSKLEALSHVDIADQPVIGLNDIVSYNITNHEITLTENGMKNITDLRVPTTGTSFLVCINRSPVYWGAFWTPISSQSFNGVTIEIPLGTQDTGTITIALGYPSQSFFRGADPRNDPTVMNSLKQAEKMIHSPDNPLPHSFKGYELYSWQQDNQWNFTLITGTNRNKTIQEIITGNDTVSEDGWVNIHIIGLDALKGIIRTIPENEDVIWWSGPSAEEFSIRFAFPPAAAIDDVKVLAAQCGVNLTVLAP